MYKIVDSTPDKHFKLPYEVHLTDIEFSNIELLKSEIYKYYKLEQDYDLAKQSVIDFKSAMYRGCHEISLHNFDDEIYRYEIVSKLSLLIFNSLNLLKKYHENIIQYGKNEEIKCDLLSDITNKKNTYVDSITTIRKKEIAIGEAIRNYCQHAAIPTENCTYGGDQDRTTKQFFVKFSLRLPTSKILKAKIQRRNRKIIESEDKAIYDLHDVVDCYFDAITDIHFQSRKILLPYINQNINKVSNLIEKYTIEFKENNHLNPTLQVTKNNDGFFFITLGSLPTLIKYLSAKNDSTPCYSARVERRTYY
ncbi:hypothetical protein [Shewanella litoralis]|uniref:Uncharacterized protein n=1 Tax=Shewanella litoralis TaxID=2282700 RepID=A0ABQ2R673_9GAMM|nr:hypothetical protein [Shewanella litoralis]GGQ14534.1 hypothetical protein GCM10009411_13780 [Shewanella litoralis]